MKLDKARPAADTRAPRGPVTWVFAAIVVSVFLSAGAVLAVSFVPYERSAAYAHIWMRRPDRFTSAYFAGIVLRLRMLSAVLLLLTIGMSAFRQPIINAIRETILALPTFLRDLRLAASRTRNADAVYLAGTALMTLAAGYIRIRHLNLPMACDEAYTFNAYASKPLFFGLSYYSAANNHLLHTMLMHFAWLAGGMEPWVLRFPAVIAGILTIPAAFFTCRYLFGSRVALMATGLTAVSIELTAYSVNARGYTLLTLLFLLSILLSGYVIRTANAAGTAVLAVLCSLGFYTIPIMLYGFGSLVAWMFVSRLRASGYSQQWWPALAPVARFVMLTGTITGALYLPVFAGSGIDYFLHQPDQPENIHASGIINLLGGLGVMLAGVWNDWHQCLPFCVSLILNAGVLLSIGIRRHWPWVHPVWGMALFCIPLLLIMRIIPYNRVWLYFLPVYYGVAADGLIALSDRIMRHRAWTGRPFLFTTCVTLLTLVQLYRADAFIPERQSVANWSLADGEQIVAYLRDHLEDGDMILAPGPSCYVLEYHFTRAGLRRPPFFSDIEKPQRIFIVERTGTNDSALNQESIQRIPGFGQARETNLHLERQFPESRLFVLPRMDAPLHGD